VGGVQMENIDIGQHMVGTLFAFAELKKLK
jgi:hypothetical protein